MMRNPGYIFCAMVIYYFLVFFLYTQLMSTHIWEFQWVIPTVRLFSFLPLLPEELILQCVICHKLRTAQTGVFSTDGCSLLSSGY